MTRRVVLTSVAVTAFVLVVLVVPLGRTVASRERERLVSGTEHDAAVLAAFVADGFDERTPEDLQAVADRYAAGNTARVVVVGVDGIALADTEQPGGGGDFSTRPEIETALGGRTAAGERHSDTLDTDLVYVAVPVASGGVVSGAVRVTYPTDALDEQVRAAWTRLVLLALSALVTSALVGALLARGVTRPVRRLEAATTGLGRGDLSRRVPADAGPPELRRLAGSWNEMAARLEILVGAQRAFVADASHQLRTPLTALRLRLENLAAELPEDRAPEVEAAGAEVARLGRLVDGLLALARAEAAGSTAPAAPVVVDPVAVARDRVEAWEPLGAELDVAIVVEPDGAGPGPVRAVDGALEQVLDGLLANALDVAPPGSEVAVRLTRTGRRVLVAVVDHGRGMPADQRARAFDRFWRAPDAPPGGSGLGLAIVQHLAAASGGEAFLAETPGGGLTAGVRLPSAADDPRAFIPAPGPPA